MGEGDIEEGQNNNTSERKNYSMGKTELELYKAALSNDWKKAENIYQNSGIGYGAKITKRGETALHIASLAGYTDFVRNLVQKMDKCQIYIQMEIPRSENKTKNGNTAFHCAALSGNVETAKAIAMKDSLHNLATLRGNGDFLPIYMAGFKGHKEMVKYLYKATISLLDDPNPTDELKTGFKDVLITLIKSDIFDVALDLGKELLNRDMCCEEMKEDALHELAKKHVHHVGFLYKFIHPFRAAETNLMNKAKVELVELLWEKLILDETKVQKLIESEDGNVILEAARQGNFEFLSTLIASYPHVLFSYDNNKYTIFHHAILHRHVEIFKLIHIGSVKTIVTTFQDKGRNMLHLAGKLAPSHRLNIVPGAALQLQRELLWFEEVKKVMDPHEVHRKIEEAKKVIDPQEVHTKIEEKESLNIEKVEYSPHDILVKEHKELMDEGEKWMRDTANSCMVVSALITTIAFAAAITVPGGTSGDDAYPNFVDYIFFKIFAVADSVSLICSATSLHGFLSILTARYTIDDFRWSLPNKLVIGLLTLFVSIVAMMVAFVMSIFIIFKDHPKSLAIMICIGSGLPITVFIWQHCFLFLDVVYSTYMSFLLFKSRGDPNLLMKGKNKKRKPLYARACEKFGIYM